MIGIIDKNRLTTFREICKEYEFLLKKKLDLASRLGIKAVRLDDVKIMTGNGNRTSEQERYALKLEKINSKIAEYEAWLKPEREKIVTAIYRIKRWEYRKLLNDRYLKGKKWSEIVADFFDCEKDYEEEKNDKYRDKMMDWNKQALEQLLKVTSEPYIEAEFQQVRLFNG